MLFIHGVWNRVTTIYQSMNRNKMYKFFGVRFYRENQTIPRKLSKRMIYSKENLGSGDSKGLMFTNELKLNHKQSWDEAIKLGYNNQGVEEIAESMQGIFHVNSKNRKVYLATKADKKEKDKQPAKKTEKKTEKKTTNKPNKKKVNNLMGAQTQRRQESRPQKPTYTAKPGVKKDFKKSPRKFKMDPSRLRSIPGSSDKM